MLRLLRIGAYSLIALSALLLLTTTTIQASGQPARTTTVAAGSNIIDVNFSQDPPYADQALDITIAPHTSQPSLSGELIAEPGSGTDATPLHVPLSATGNQAAPLQGTLHLPVRGAWNIKIQLQGAQGRGTATIAVVVAAPGAMPSWLAWLIGSSPLVVITIWLWNQHRYRRTLLAYQTT